MARPSLAYRDTRTPHGASLRWVCCIGNVVLSFMREQWGGESSGFTLPFASQKQSPLF